MNDYYICSSVSRSLGSFSNKNYTKYVNKLIDGMKNAQKNYSLQFSSSDRSWQSKLPSHFQLPWIHCPLAHSNSWVLQRTVFVGCFPAQFDGHSSDPSAQSSSPSHCHRPGTHTELLHWKDPGVQVGLGQEASSEPSEQSLSLSQRKEVDIHWPLAQRNSSARHCLAAVVSQEMGEILI